MVIWEHWYSRSFEAHAPAFLDPLVSAGNYGVEIFFVLSGFVLYLPYCNGRPFVARTYLVHRARRLLPLFYVALFASAALHRDNPFPYALLLYPNPQRSARSSTSRSGRSAPRSGSPRFSPSSST